VSRQIKRLRCGQGVERETLKTELRALSDLCQFVLIDDHGVVQSRQSTLTKCHRCSREGGCEFLDGGIWIRKAAIDTPLTPRDSDNAIGASLSESLFTMLTIKAPPSVIVEKNLSCPFLVSFIDSFPDTASDGQCIVMEYMRWGSLQDIMAGGHRFTADELAVVAYSTLRALMYMTEHGYVHRDIKVRMCAAIVFLAANKNYVRF
jgi:hypothetical protein